MAAMPYTPTQNYGTRLSLTRAWQRTSAHSSRITGPIELRYRGRRQHQLFIAVPLASGRHDEIAGRATPRPGAKFLKRRAVYPIIDSGDTRRVPGTRRNRLHLEDAITLFRRLGVDVQSLAAPEFTRAYFRLAKRYHPDQGDRYSGELMAHINAARTAILKARRGLSSA
jgi:hypothetical protein